MIRKVIKPNELAIPEISIDDVNDDYIYLLCPVSSYANFYLLMKEEDGEYKFNGINPIKYNYFKSGFKSIRVACEDAIDSGGTLYQLDDLDDLIQVMAEILDDNKSRGILPY